MAHLESALFDIEGFDLLAMRNTSIHRRDPRAKVLVALAFIATVVSFGKYEIARVLPLVLYPVALIALAGLPPRYLFGKVLLAAPFAIVVGLFNPLMDTTPLFHIGTMSVSGGWISYGAILVRFVLTLLAGLILVATTGFYPVCAALARLRLPRALVTQLLLLYRYFFVLGDEASRMWRAWSLRAVRPGRIPMRTFARLAGQLLVRAMDRAQNVHMAMLCRGFDGQMPTLRTFRFQAADGVFIFGWSAFFLLVRLYDLPHALGRAVMECLS